MTTGLTWLVKLTLPTRTVHLSDGGVTVFAGDKYKARDSQIGALSSIAEIREGAGGEIASLSITLAPPSSAAMTVLTQAALAQLPIRAWLAEYDLTTGAVVGTPEQRWTGFQDKPTVSFALRQLSITIESVPELETVFFKDIGNGMSASFQKQLFPGDTGHDQGTGLVNQVFWGVAGSNSGGGAGGGGGGNINPELRPSFL